MILFSIFNKFKIKAGIIILSSFFTSCSSSSSYLCFTEDKTASHLLSWDSYGVDLNHISFSFYKKIFSEGEGPHYQEQLHPLMDSGTYNITITEEKMIIRFIQDAQETKLQRADGKFVAINSEDLFSEIKTKGLAIVYVATFPHLKTYTFDRKQEILTVHSKKLFPPRKKELNSFEKGPTKRKYWLDTGAEYTDSKIIGSLNDTEIKTAFFSNHSQKITERFYPHCEQKNPITSLFLRALSFIKFF